MECRLSLDVNTPVRPMSLKSDTTEAGHNELDYNGLIVLIDLARSRRDRSAGLVIVSLPITADQGDHVLPSSGRLAATIAAPSGKSVAKGVKLKVSPRIESDEAGVADTPILPACRIGAGIPL